MTARRGWRERVEPDLYRAHRLACPSSADQRPVRRCRCPWQVAVPGRRQGATRLVTVTGSIGEARAERRRLLPEGRPEPVAAPVALDTLDEFTGHFLRARSAVLAPAAIYSYEKSYRLRVSAALGRLRLDEITRERVESWLADLMATASSRRMVTKSVEALRAILAAAVAVGPHPGQPGGAAAAAPRWRPTTSSRPSVS